MERYLKFTFLICLLVSYSLEAQPKNNLKWVSNLTLDGLNSKAKYAGVFENSVLTTDLEASFTKEIVSTANLIKGNGLLTTDGEVYVWGDNIFGVYPSDQIKWIEKPRKIEFPGNEKIKQITFGDKHCIALTNSGKVYSWGTSTKNLNPVGRTLTTYNKFALHRVYFPTKNIVQISAGSYHTLALSDKGQVFAWGDNSMGQLGNIEILSSENAKDPVKVNLENQTIKEVVAGRFHSFFINQNNELWACGNNAFRQILPNIADSFVSIPKKWETEGGYTVKKIATSEQATLLMTTQNQILCFGKDIRDWQNSITTNDKF